MLGSSLRPECLLDTVEKIVPGGDTQNSNRNEQKQLLSACSDIPRCLKELAEFLNNQEVFWVDALELKEIFHSHGINFKLLHRVY